MDGVSYMVRGGTQDECQEALDRLCRLLEAEPTLPPSDRLDGRWVARATAKAPDREIRG